MMGYGGYGGGMYGMSNYGESELTLKVKVGSCNTLLLQKPDCIPHKSEFLRSLQKTARFHTSPQNLGGFSSFLYSTKSEKSAGLCKNVTPFMAKFRKHGAITKRFIIYNYVILLMFFFPVSSLSVCFLVPLSCFKLYSFIK